MTRLSLKEEFARLGPLRGVDRVCSGSPAVLDLRLGEDTTRVKTVTAILSLSKRGLSILRAKRAIEGLLETGGVTIQLPMVEDLTALTDELFHSGIIVFQTAVGQLERAAE